MLKINERIQFQKITRFIQRGLKKTSFDNIAIALSGGIDSSVVYFLLNQSVKNQNIYILAAPYNNFDIQGQKNIQLMIKKYQPIKKNIKKINIKPIVDLFSSQEPDMNLIRIGNIMARIRMILLYDWAKKNNALVCGTENKSEHLFGYYTRFGDEASDLEPIRHLYKTQVIKLAKYLKLPQEIINKKPTAGLWQGQTDEEELGFSYAQADEILYLYFDKKLSKEQIINQGINQQIVEKVIKRVKDNSFKEKVPYHI